MARKLRGIIVDDDDDIIDLFTEFLEMKGLSIIGRARNGYEAARTYKTASPDFVILDIKMPQYDGDYAIREIKKINPDANIFVVTGYFPYELEGDVTAIISKPCDLTKLCERIKRSIPENLAV